MSSDHWFLSCMSAYPATYDQIGLPPVLSAVLDFVWVGRRRPPREKITAFKILSKQIKRVDYHKSGAE